MTKENIYTAYAKGMAEGAIKSGLVCLGIAGVVYAFGKMVMEVETENEKVEELEDIDSIITQDKDVDWENES